MIFITLSACPVPSLLRMQNSIRPFNSYGTIIASQSQLRSPFRSPLTLNPFTEPRFYNRDREAFISPSTYGAPQFYAPQSPTSGFATTDNQLEILPTGFEQNRTVCFGDIPPDTSVEEPLGHVRSGQIESVCRHENCAYISFMDEAAANHFYLTILSIRVQNNRVGWGGPSQVPTLVACAVQQLGASRNVYLGNLPNVTEEQLRMDLGNFGQVDTIKIFRGKDISAGRLTFRHPGQRAWTQRQNVARIFPPSYTQSLDEGTTTANEINSQGNRTIFLGNIHPKTTIEEICNVVRGELHYIRYIHDKHICFVTFVNPMSAASYYALGKKQGLVIRYRTLTIGWGRHSGALPLDIAQAVSRGASRSVYIGNINKSWTEERLRQDFSAYGEIEHVNILRKKSCAFVNLTHITDAIVAIKAVRKRIEYKHCALGCKSKPSVPASVIRYFRHIHSFDLLWFPTFRHDSLIPSCVSSNPPFPPPSPPSFPPWPVHPPPKT